jgi:hypothetical protein
MTSAILQKLLAGAWVGNAAKYRTQDAEGKLGLRLLNAASKLDIS